MISTILWACGLVLCVEGLVVALAPGRLEEVLNLLRRLSLDARRLIGLSALTVGVGLLALARMLGA